MVIAEVTTGVRSLHNLFTQKSASHSTANKQTHHSLPRHRPTLERQLVTLAAPRALIAPRDTHGSESIRRIVVDRERRHVRACKGVTTSAPGGNVRVGLHGARGVAGKDGAVNGRFVVPATAGFAAVPMERQCTVVSTEY